MNNHSKVHCYAVRRLNPFQGVLQVVATASVQAGLLGTERSM